MLCDLIKHKHGYALFIYSSDTTVNGTVRLVDGRNMKEGRVQMYYNGKWHSICSDPIILRHKALLCWWFYTCVRLGEQQSSDILMVIVVMKSTKVQTLGAYMKYVYTSMRLLYAIFLQNLKHISAMVIEFRFFNWIPKKKEKNMDNLWKLLLHIILHTYYIKLNFL